MNRLRIYVILSGGIIFTIFAAQIPTPAPLPDVIASLAIKEFSVSSSGTIEKLTIKAEYFSRTQVPGSPIKPELKGAVEFDLVKLGDRQIILTHADALTGHVINRHFSCLDAALLLKAIADLQWFETMPPPASNGPIVVAVQPRLANAPPPPASLEKVALEMAQRRALRGQPAATSPTPNPP